MDPVAPDYAGAAVTGVVPALIGARGTGETVAWMPEPVAGARAVVLLVLDGLGWHALRECADRLPVLAAMEGTPIRTVVPSTTAAALTSITTGLAPSQHGVVGFRFRVDGTVLNALTWQQANGRRGPAPIEVQRHDAFLGRPLPIITKAEFRTTGFTEVHLRGVQFNGWRTTSELVEHCRNLARTTEPLVYAYYPGVDEVAHSHGLHDGFYAAELRATDRLVGDVLDALPDDVALLVTSDHGQVHLEPSSWRELGPVADLCEGYWGDARFRYLAAVRGATDELAAEARRQFGADAWVLTRSELVDRGWLGPPPSPAARRRLGDVVLAAKGDAVFVDPTFELERRLRSAHGSLTAAEMEVPLLAARGRG